MTAQPLPGELGQLTADHLNAAIGVLQPQPRVSSFDVIEAKGYGEEMVSTAARALLELEFTGGEPKSRALLKFARDDSGLMAPFYNNEVCFYTRLRPQLELEAPAVLGGIFETGTGRFVLLLEDLGLRRATFPNVSQPLGVDQVRALLDTLAVLHGQHWQSPRFNTDLAWVQSHTSGALATLQNEAATPLIQHEIDHENFKREMVQRLRSSGPRLRREMMIMQQHQASLPQTLLHGDAHIGNCYLLPDGSAGLLDWQLTTRGYCIHDVSYLVTTALSVELRREHEEALVHYYLQRLGEQGVQQVPDFPTAWCEYRRTLAWSVYYGWLTTPVGNYGWEINLLNHFRLTTAYEDLGTARLIAELQ